MAHQRTGKFYRFDPDVVVVFNPLFSISYSCMHYLQYVNELAELACLWTVQRHAYTPLDSPKGLVNVLMGKDIICPINAEDMTTTTKRFCEDQLYYYLNGSV
jgi:hypothetical protein